MDFELAVKRFLDKEKTESPQCCTTLARLFASYNHDRGPRPMGEGWAESAIVLSIDSNQRKR
jgi:hypothetical protein